MPTQIDPNKLAELQMDKCKPEIIPELCLLGFEDEPGFDSCEAVRTYYHPELDIRIYDNRHMPKDETEKRGMGRRTIPFNIVEIDDVMGRNYEGLPSVPTVEELIKEVSEFLEWRRTQK